MNKTVRILILSVVFLFVTGFFAFVASTQAATIANGDLIKASGPAVYYYAVGKRYVFPNQNTYLTWYTNFSGVKVITDSELASIPIGGNVTYRPGVKLVKITTDPKVYAVDAHGTLRWIASESAAAGLYGSSWAKLVEDIPDPFFVNYNVGAQISTITDFFPDNAKSEAYSIYADKVLRTYSSSSGLLFSYTAASNGRPELAPLGEKNIIINEKTTSDGYQILVGPQSYNDVTIDIHIIPQGKTAEAYVRELTDKIIGSSCSYEITQKQMSNLYSVYELTDSSGCFIGLIIPEYRQYWKRTDLLIGVSWNQDTFMTEDEINQIVDSIVVN